MSKKKGNRGQNQVKPASSTASASAVKVELTAETVKASTTEEEFNKKKDELIAQFDEDIRTYEELKDAAEKAANLAEATKADLETKIEGLRGDRESLTSEVVRLKKDRDEAEKKIKTATEEAESIKNQAEEDAQRIREEADAERIKKVDQANKAAQKAWQKQVDSLQSQIEDIAERERALNEQKIALSKEQSTLEFEKEELAELQAHVKALKEKYVASNPARVSELEIDLRDEQERYRVLLEKYNALSEKLQDTQVLLDTIKTEIEGPRGGKKSVAVTSIISELQELKAKYDALVRIHEKYHDEETIAQLEEKAERADALERERNALELERNRYREEAVAARNASKELEVVKQEVEATNALNEHLLQELESHKTALESRTGDTCPSLSKVDSEVDDVDFVASVNERFQKTQLTSLAQIVSHVKNFAGSGCGNNGVKLFYSDNDLRAFLSGMAVSKLIILQGMSGTGKSNLPEVFAEAIYGFEKLIPVESSWRDRNELLGYYNDFNKKFNAKTFTIELYRLSKERCQQIPSLMILDEMNLARIEYYFSDFLSILQKTKKDEWMIELVSSDMRTLPMELPEEVKKRMKKEVPTIFAVWEKIERSRQGDLTSETSDEEKEQLTTYLAKLGHLTGAKDLIDGRKIQVTDNIWFIGTANRDESTFEISDKVYDRAQVVSLNKKGKAEGRYTKTEKKFISVEDLQKLFESAKLSFKHSDEVMERLDRLDEVLMEKFDISFGNRIVTQTMDFVAVFMAAGGSMEDALDYQISTKILRKIITSDDEDALLELQAATLEYPETQRLLEKRIKDLGR